VDYGSGIHVTEITLWICIGCWIITHRESFCIVRTFLDVCLGYCTSNWCMPPMVVGSIKKGLEDSASYVLPECNGIRNSSWNFDVLSEDPSSGVTRGGGGGNCMSVYTKNIKAIMWQKINESDGFIKNKV
jgi:hypothetical protein